MLNEKMIKKLEKIIKNNSKDLVTEIIGLSLEFNTLVKIFKTKDGLIARFYKNGKAEDWIVRKLKKE